MYFGVVDINRIPSTGNSEDGRIIKEVRKLLCVQSGRTDEKFQIRSEPGHIL